MLRKHMVFGCLLGKMYNVSIGPSKIVAKTRRGISQNFERLENLRDLKRNPYEHEEGDVMNGPKPVFHTNNRKSSNGKQLAISPFHEELIKYVSDSWNKVCKEYTMEPPEETYRTTSSNGSIIYYEDTEPNRFLQDFQPFDLESLWRKRLFKI